MNASELIHQARDKKYHDGYKAGFDWYPRERTMLTYRAIDSKDWCDGVEDGWMDAKGINEGLNTEWSECPEDCPACLRKHWHSLAEHEGALRRNDEASSPDEPEYNP